MNNIILGSGLIGLLARHILGSTWTIIPFKKSRYYSYDIPIADNDITYTEVSHDAIKQLCTNDISIYFPIAMSYRGFLTFNKNLLVNVLVDKIYGDNIHPMAAHMLSHDCTAHSTTAKHLFDILLDMYKNDIIKNASLEVDKISDHQIFYKDGSITYFNEIISTIPLNALSNLVGISSYLKSKPYNVFLVTTDAFNLEGAKRCFIADLSIPFWKVNVLSNGIYQFFANEIVDDYNKIFGLLTNGRKFEVLASTVIDEAFPLGRPPIDLINELLKHKIQCVGGNARWDYFYDISTAIRDLTTYGV